MPNKEAINQIRLDEAVITVDDSAILVKDRDNLQNKKRYNLNISAFVNGLLATINSSISTLTTQLGLKADKSIVINTTSPLQGGGDLSANRTLSILNASTSQTGVLTSADWNTFNNKQNIANSFSVITATGIFPNNNVIFFGNGAINMTGTIPTSSMVVGQIITIKRNVGATGTLTLQGQSGQIQALNNTLGATTTLAAAGAYGQSTDFLWNGTNLLRINNG